MLVETLLGAGLFTAIVFLLAIVVLLARSMLVPQGNAGIIINDSRELTAPAGSKLLEALLANDILLPSACGGSGSCGQCRIKVEEGGGQLLPTETSFISRREAAAGQRLACQVPLLAETSIRLRLPESVFSARRFHCQVSSSQNVATYIREIAIQLPDTDTMEFRAGDYIMVECPPHQMRLADIVLADQYRDDWQRFGLLEMESVVREPVRRAYSMANSPAEKEAILLNVRLATPPPSSPTGTPPGQVSSYLFGLKPGDAVTVSGPYGEFYVNESEAEMIFVGGGAGMAPMRSHIFDQLKSKQTSRKMSFWYGARSLRETFYAEQFDALAAAHDNFDWHLALSEPQPLDKWNGLTGFIHEVLFEQYLKDHPAPEDCEYYLCGPPMMVTALLHMFNELGVGEQNIYFDDFSS
jgi:Na+-transporting NADH:ubiquinone oxidoreductase subunit F